MPHRKKGIVNNNFSIIKNMKQISLTIVMIFGCSLSFYGQENNQIKLIKNFYQELYTINVSPKEISSKYIEYSDVDQYEKAINMIMDFRNLATEENGHFFLLKKDISENNFSISPFSSLEEVDKSKFKNLTKRKQKNVYKVDFKNTIPQYILMKKNKIMSFFGFQKAGSDDYIFIVF